MGGQGLERWLASAGLERGGEGLTGGRYRLRPSGISLRTLRGFAACPVRLAHVDSADQREKKLSGGGGGGAGGGGCTRRRKADIRLPGKGNSQLPWHLVPRH